MDLNLSAIDSSQPNVQDRSRDGRMTNELEGIARRGRCDNAHAGIVKDPMQSSAMSGSSSNEDRLAPERVHASHETIPTPLLGSTVEDH